MDSMDEYYPVTPPDEKQEDLDFLGDISSNDGTLVANDSEYSEEFEGEELTPSPSPILQDSYSSDLSDALDDGYSAPIGAIINSAPNRQANRRRRARTAAIHVVRRRPPKPKGNTHTGILRRGLHYLGISKKRGKNPEAAATGTGTCNVTSFRLLSAKQREVDHVHNQLIDVKKRFDVMQRENRTLKTLQQRQDRAIRRFEDEESDIPKIMHQHTEEQKALKIRLRKAQISERTLEAKLRANNNDMQKMERRLRRLKEIVQKEDLGERIALARRLENTNTNLTVAERTIEKLDKKLGLTVNSFTRQIRTERLRHKETKEQLQKIKSECVEAEMKLREKERAIGAANIYFHRKRESPKKLHKAEDAIAPARDEELMSRCTQTLREESQTDEYTQISMPYSPAKNEQSRKPEKRSLEKGDETNESATPNVRFEKTTGKTPEETLDCGVSLPAAGPEPRVQKDAPGMKKIFGNKTPVLLTSKFAPPPQLQSAPVTTTCDVSKAPLVVDSQFTQNIPPKDDNMQVNTGSCDASPPPPVSQLNTPQQVPVTCHPQVVECSDLDAERYEEKESEKEPQHRRQQVESPAARRKRKTYQFTREVQNLHLGIPSVVGVTKGKQKEEGNEIHFGGYAPTIGAVPVRKMGSETTPEKKNSDFLKQLFGDLESSKLSNPQDAEAENFVAGTRNLLKSFEEEGLLDGFSSTTHLSLQTPASYPWEKNVVTSSNLQGNGDNVSMPAKVTTPGRCLEEDFENLAL